MYGPEILDLFDLLGPFSLGATAESWAQDGCQHDQIKEILQKKVASFGNPYHNTFDMFGQHSAEAAKSRLRVW
jgi:hypothetical protein